MISWCQHIYALTGSIGAGKTTVCDVLRRLGAYIINADDLARKAVEPGSEGIREIGQVFGSTVLLKDGSLNRELMGQIVFSNPSDRTKLEEITHPIVHRLAKQEYRRAAEINPPAIIFDVPLLFETGLHRAGFKGIIVVYASEEQCIERLVNTRKMTMDEARKRYHCQIPITEKIALADYVIDNNGDKNSLESQVLKLFNKIASVN